MRVRRLWVRDFRNLSAAELAPPPGLTALVGSNGEGKTNVLEAVAYLATLTSFRGAPGEALVREGADRAVVRAELDLDQPGRSSSTTVEAELRPHGRDRVLVDRQPLRRVVDLAASVRVTVFSPDDLALVKDGPAHRRRYLDDLLVAGSPALAGVRHDLDRVLRQRASLLRQAGGRLSADVATTLDVWDAKLGELGDRLGRARARLVDQLEPAVAESYNRVASSSAGVTLSYEAPWRVGGLAAALAAARDADVRRGAGTVGPQRDELVCTIAGLAARTHASQGEQRSLALALRLAGHEVVRATTGSSPVLLLDDVFSELDHDRSAALLAHLPQAQTLLTTTGPLPDGAVPELVVRVRAGHLEAVAGARGLAS